MEDLFWSLYFFCAHKNKNVNNNLSKNIAHVTWASSITLLASPTYSAVAVERHSHNLKPIWNIFYWNFFPTKTDIARLHCKIKFWPKLSISAKESNREPQLQVMSLSLTAQAGRSLLGSNEFCLMRIRCVFLWVYV